MGASRGPGRGAGQDDLLGPQPGVAIRETKGTVAHIPSAKLALHRPTGRLLHRGEGWLRTGSRPAMLSLILGLLAVLLARVSLASCAVVVLGSIGLVLAMLRPTLALYALAFAVPFGSLRE